MNTIINKISPGFFRLFLAFIVVVHHSVDFLVIGHAAVYMFFILSGYWIAKMYQEKYVHYTNSYKVFIISRLMRLFPVYYLILLISIIVAIFYRNLFDKDELYNPFFYLTNLLIIGQNNAKYLLTATGWSLDIELQFYFLAPLLLLLTKHKAIVTLVVTILATIIYAMFGSSEYIIVITYLPLFVIGMIIYTNNWIFSHKTSFICISILLLFYLCNYIIADMRHIFLDQKNYTLIGVPYKELVNIILSMLAVPFITINVRNEATGQCDKIFSSMSYVIYLLHYPLILIYSSYVGGLSVTEKIPYLVVCISACILFSYIISKYYDQYFEKKRSTYLKLLPKKVIIEK